MASKFPNEREETGQLRTRKGHDMTWSCDKHGEPIKFYCGDHTISICHPCATKDHQKPCKLVDIEDVILEMSNMVENAKTKIAPAKKGLKTLRSKLESSETSTSNHLQSVSDNVNATYDGKLNSVKDKERNDIRLINEEADEEIRIINEKRETRIKACKEEAEKQQQISKDSQAKLLSEIKKIDMKVRKMIEDLKSKYQHEINAMDNMDSKIERIKQDDKTLVNEAPQVIAELDESLSSNVHQEVADYLDRIEREVQRVRFVEGELGGKHYERIDGYIGKWEPVKSIAIPSTVKKAWVRGLISDDEICVLDVSDEALYVTNISTEHTEKAQESCQTTGDGSTLPLECTICQKKFTGQPSARQHFESSKHKIAEAGATAWAQRQSQGGTAPQGAHQRSPPGLSPPGMSPLGVSTEGITASGPEATKETLSMPASSGAGQRTMPLMDAAKDGVSNQHLYQRSSPGGLPTLGGGGLQQPTRNVPVAVSAQDFTAAVGPGNQQLRQHIGQICYSVLERYLMQLIPDLCDKITDKVLEELSKATPQDSSGREAAARASLRQNGSAEELQESIKTDYASMPSLLESLSLNSLDQQGAGKSSDVVNILNNLNRPSPQQYSAVWDSLMEHKN